MKTFVRRKTDREVPCQWVCLEYKFFRINVSLKFPPAKKKKKVRLEKQALFRSLGKHSLGDKNGYPTVKDKKQEL